MNNSKITDSEIHRLHVATFPLWPSRDVGLYALAYPACVAGRALNDIACEDHANGVQGILECVGCAA